ncbi:RagB/SusD family nutrient uptake outer membrane protein [Sphingobacterium sp. JB170]|uniref:RagB/SusD family nutrient uptake outer membrane protein n=1 Tax=Sphingobacterium sp. JB170 TaxID=1434842 RepID=UPI00097F656D|nr:RagB/SusD family nutrient uptake outer membrane protein [Sphingobacterium sp. JB170]SJN47462.1 putative outer membrane protein, probably involved in nutrient binding [Sphingobacterium sp. JB170]
MYRFFTYTILLVSLLSTSCDKDFLNQTPDDVISEDLVTGSVDKLDRLLSGSYNEISSPNYLGRLLQKRAAVKSPDFRFVQTIYNPRNYEQIEYRYEESANNNGSAADLWQQCYKIIGNLNLIVTYIDQAEGDPLLARRVKAQAYALRAMVYFDLARTFAYPWIKDGGASQGLPLKLAPQSEVTDRSTLEQTFNQILSDFQLAESFFTTKTDSDDDPKYIDRTAIYALRARVYLYKQDWANALAEAQKVFLVLPESRLMSRQNYNFRDFNSESIFELSVNEDNSAGSNGLGAQFDFNRGGQGDVLATTTFVNLLETYSGDPRAAFLAQDKEGQKHSFLKYVNRSGAAGLSVHNIPVIRLSEVFLIAAEACANGAAGGEKQALVYLNALIANRTGDFQKDKAFEAGDALLARIYNERRKELALEGHEIYDLLRTGRAVIRPDADHVNTGLNTRNLSVAPFSPQMIYPIPAAEISASGMEQTEGY